MYIKNTLFYSDNYNLYIQGEYTMITGQRYTYESLYLGEGSAALIL
jgi:hypothetical protein